MTDTQGTLAVKTDKTRAMLDLWCSAPGVDFVDASAERAYKERARRVADAIQLKVPDRVPIVPSFGLFPALDNGLTCEEAMFDPEKARGAWLKTLTDFEPDAYGAPALWGPVVLALDYKPIKLPGHGIPTTHTFQFVEWEYVPADEFYDAFLDDPTDFMLRAFLPRVCGILEPLKKLRPIREWFGYYQGILGNVSAFGTPEIAGALEALIAAGKEAQKYGKASAAMSREIMALGFPQLRGSGAAAPFDVIGDWFRGTRGVMLDMYRRPQKLLAAMERLVPILIEMGLQAKQMRCPFVSMPLHKGSEGFMSLEQFRTFYWPTFRKVMLGLIEEGLVPVPIVEGENTSRLEVMKDIPPGKAVYWFEKVDLSKAKEVLGDTVCFKGNVPVSLLCTGTPQQVSDYVTELVDIVGKGGGLMVDCGIAGFDDARHENVKAMIDRAREYGRY